MVLMAIGVMPNVEIAKEVGIEIGKTGAIRTDSYQRTNIHDIYTAGDCCEVFNLISQNWVHTPLGDIANKQGRVAGENAAGGEATFQGVDGSAALKSLSSKWPLQVWVLMLPVSMALMQIRRLLKQSQRLAKAWIQTDAN